MGGKDMDQCGGAAAKLPESERKDLAILALARSQTVSELARRHEVSRKFIYQQTRKARVALDDAFSSETPEDGVLFQFTVTKAWLRQVIVALPLMCHSSYRGVIEFLRDLLGIPVSLGTVHDVLQSAARQAGLINAGEDLSAIRVGLHDEIFQGGTPVLAGVDAGSTYCYLLVAAEHRDADTWGVHLLDATKQGLKPDYTIADAGQGLRAGQKAVWDDTPCHGDVFHIQHQYEGLANTLSRLAKGARSRRQKLEARIDRAGQHGPDDELMTQLKLAQQIEAQASWLARDIRTLTQWLSHDVLALAGPPLASRQVLFDFIVAELAHREPADARRVRPVRVALRNQRDELLAFAGVLDDKLAAIAQAHEIAEPIVREACALHRLPSTSSAYWQGWNTLRTKLGERCHALFDAVARAMAETPRSSSLVENLNSRLRNYFTLRRQLGGSYLDLLRFFLNHRRFMRSRRTERNGKSPRELLTNQGHPHWLTLLGLGPLQLRQG
jgi:transposase-like protein